MWSCLWHIIRLMRCLRCYSQLAFDWGKLDDANVICRAQNAHNLGTYISPPNSNLVFPVRKNKKGNNRPERRLRSRTQNGGIVCYIWTTPLRMDNNGKRERDARFLSPVWIWAWVGMVACSEGRPRFCTTATTLEISASSGFHGRSRPLIFPSPLPSARAFFGCENGLRDCGILGRRCRYEITAAFSLAGVETPGKLIVNINIK